MIGFLALLLSYLLGGIPFGFLVAKAKGVNIMDEGSKSIGATNVGRVIGKKAYFLVLFLDIVKGVAPGLVVPMVAGAQFGLAADEFGLVCALGAVAGHLASPYLGFKGGKGIATGLGLLLGSAPPVAATVLVVWGIVFLLSRIVSMASLSAVVSLVAGGIYFYGGSVVYMSVFVLMSVFIFYKHRSNIGRILKGEEAKFSFSKKSGDGGEDAASASQEEGGGAR